MEENVRQITWSLQDQGNARIGPFDHSEPPPPPRKTISLQTDNRRAVGKKKKMKQGDEKVPCVFMNFSDTFISKKEERADN